MAARHSPESATADREIVLQRVLDAPRELVWHAFTSPEHVAQWWGPTGFTITTHEMDVRPGGAWVYLMHGPDGTDYPTRTEYIEVVVPERLVYDLSSGEQDDPYAARVTITFDEQQGKTLFTMRSVLASAEARAYVIREHNAIEGGNQTLDRLTKHLVDMQGTLTAFEGRTLTITRVFDAPRELVFNTWIDPKHFVQWWGPKGFTTPFCELDPQPGGSLRFCMRWPEGQGPDMWCGGVYHEVTAPERIVYTVFFTDRDGNKVSPKHYGMEGIPDEMLVTVTFEDVAGRTRMTLRHSDLPGDQGESEGWNESFDKLATYLTAIAA